MSHPKEKGKNRQRSSGRPGTKFLEPSGVESGTVRDESGFGGLNTTEAQSGEDLRGENWKVAGPKPKDPKKMMEQDKVQGDDQRPMGKED